MIDPGLMVKPAYDPDLHTRDPARQEPLNWRNDSRSASHVASEVRKVLVPSSSAFELSERESKLFDVLMHSVPGFVWLADGQGNVDFVNDAWCDYTGLDSHQSYGQGWMAALHPEDLAAWRGAGLPSRRVRRPPTRSRCGSDAMTACIAGTSSGQTRLQTRIIAGSHAPPTSMMSS